MTDITLIPNHIHVVERHDGFVFEGVYEGCLNGLFVFKALPFAGHGGGLFHFAPASLVKASTPICEFTLTLTDFAYHEAMRGKFSRQ